MRLRNLFTVSLFLMLLFLEEEEEHAEYYKDVPRNVDELKKWANEFHARVDYPLYGIVLASEADSEVVSFVQNHHTELAQISGDECCFIYFHDLKRAKDLAPFQYSKEHTNWVYQIADLIGINYNHLPGFLFFERVDSGKYVYISLKGKSQQEVLTLARKMFGHKSHAKNSSGLVKLRGFKRLHQVSILGEKIERYTVEVVKGVAVELIKAFADAVIKRI